jgi:hypothetical protein
MAIDPGAEAAVIVCKGDPRWNETITAAIDDYRIERNRGVADLAFADAINLAMERAVEIAATQG